jgi:hypothetical protein
VRGTSAGFDNPLNGNGGSRTRRSSVEAEAQRQQGNILPASTSAGLAFGFNILADFGCDSDGIESGDAGSILWVFDRLGLDPPSAAFGEKASTLRLRLGVTFVSGAGGPSPSRSRRSLAKIKPATSMRTESASHAQNAARRPNSTSFQEQSSRSPRS